MIKKMAWNMFEQTGDINSFLQYKDIEAVTNFSNNTNEDLNKQISNINDIENYVNSMISEENIGGILGNNKNKWYSD